MRAIAFVTRLIDEGTIDSDKYARIRVHGISESAAMEQLGVATKLNPDWQFLMSLRDVGRRAADAWLTTHFDGIGKESTVNVAELYL